MKLLQKALMIILSTIILTSCSSSSSTTSNTTNIEDPSHPTENTLLIYGDVVIDTRESINFDFPFKVTEVHVKNGQNVNAGDILMSVDLSDYMLDISSKQNEIKESKLKLQHLEATSNAQVASIKKLQNDLSLKESYLSNGDPEIIPLENDLELLNRDLELKEQLYKTNLDLHTQGTLSKNELDLSELDYTNISKKIENLKTNINKLRSARKLEVESLKNDIKALQVESNNTDIDKSSNIELLKLAIANNESILAQMKSKLNKPYLNGNNIVAPSDNLIIYNLNCIKGSTLETTAGPLVELMYKDSLYATVDIPEENLSLVTPNTEVSIKLADEAKDSPEISGTITSISDHAIDKDGDNIVLGIIEITKGKEYLKPGLSLDITVPIK